MVDHIDRAIELFNNGRSCSQAVFAAFCDVSGIDEPSALKISSAFGGGICGMGGTCGAVVGMLMALGSVCGYSEFGSQQEKMDYYALARGLVERFEKEHGTVLCRDLLSNRVNDFKTEPYHLLAGKEVNRPCAAFVAYAAYLVDEIVLEKR